MLTFTVYNHPKNVVKEDWSKIGTVNKGNRSYVYTGLSRKSSWCIRLKSCKILGDKLSFIMMLDFKRISMNCPLMCQDSQADEFVAGYMRSHYRSGQLVGEKLACDFMIVC